VFCRRISARLYTKFTRSKVYQVFVAEIKNVQIIFDVLALGFCLSNPWPLVLSLGIRFIAASQGLDTDESNPASKLLMHILAAVAQFERELIHERVSAGMKAAMKHGTKTGNPIGRPRRIFNRDEVARLRASGLSIEKIASQMKIGVGTVTRVLHAARQ
jgi:hypothetical protein